MEFTKAEGYKVSLFNIFTNQNVPNFALPCLLGQKVAGDLMWIDLAATPHLLIAGTTGSGKSTVLHAIIANLMNYSKVNLVLIDPKSIEFQEYGKIPGCNVSSSYEESLFALDGLIELMESRYALLKKGYSIEAFPFVVSIIDEFADLILQDDNKQFFTKLCRLAQKCRGVKIHLVISTQRPSVNIIDGAIKANFPARIACRTASHIDSKIILDATGAEHLSGNGDALIRDQTHHLERFQAGYTNAKEICSIFGGLS